LIFFVFIVPLTLNSHCQIQAGCRAEKCEHPISQCV